VPHLRAVSPANPLLPIELASIGSGILSFCQISLTPTRGLGEDLLRTCAQGLGVNRPRGSGGWLYLIFDSRVVDGSE
jgi:hypothetical protein